MAVTASFGGQTYQFPDGTTDEQIYEALNKGVGQYGTTDSSGYGQDSLLTQENQNNDWGFYKEGQDGSIWETAKQGLGAALEGIVATNVGASRSDYANERFERQVQRAQGEEAKLGMAGNVAAGALKYAPAIAGGIINPAIGGVISGTLSSGDAVRAQQEAGEELDYDKAGMAGVATGLTDMALGGMASRFLPKPGAGAGVGARAMAQGKQILAEDVPSAMTSQAYENWAANKDLSENVGTAALMGGVAGAGVRGGLSGMSKAMEIPFNKGGEKANSDVVDIEMGAGPNPNEGFATDYAEHANVIGGIRDKIRNSSDEAEIADNLSVLNKESESNAHLDATARFAKALNKEDAHIIDSMYDVDIDVGDGKKWNIGENGLNLDKDSMTKSREELVSSKGSIFQSKRKQLDKGLTGTAFNEKSQVDGRKIRSRSQGYFNENLTNLKKEMSNSKARGDSPEVQANWRKAVDSYETWTHALTSRNKESDSIDTIHSARVMSRDFNDAVTRLGYDNKIKDMNGETGNLNILADYQGFAALTDGFRKQNKQFSQGKPDTLKESLMSYGPSTVGGAALMLGHPGIAAGAAAKEAVHEALKLGRRYKAGKNIKAAKERAASLVPSQAMDAAIRGGDGPGAATAAKVDLESQGIKTEPETVAPTPTPEAPVTPPASVASVRKADAKVRPAPAPKAVVEPVVEAPAPKAKPEAKAPKAPEKSKATIRKEKEAARKAAAEERRQAKQAKIAADMQEAIQAGAKRGEPLGRPAPAKKVEEVVEAPVKAVEEVPAPVKPEAKAKVKPAQKAVEEPVAEVTPEAPKVEEPAPKVDAKGRTKPEAKKVEEPTPEPAEAPVSTPKQPLGKSAPGRKAKAEEAVESVTEAPVKEAEVEAPKVEESKKVPAAKLVREPLKKVAEEKWPVGRRQADTEGYRAHMKAKEDLKTIDNMMRTHDKYTVEEIAQAIEDTGGASKFLAEAKDSGKTPDTFLGLRMRELERLRQAEVKNKTSEMKQILKDQTVTVPSKPTDAEVKAERVATDKKEFDDEMKALAIHADDVAQVNKSIEGGMSLKNARKEASRLNSERKATMKKEIADNEKALKEANKVMDNQGKRAQVDEYVKGLKVEGDNTISAMVDDVFKHNSSVVTPKEMQNLLNKIDKHLAKELENYRNLARASGKADPRYPEFEAMAASYRSAQNALKSNRRQVDQVYSKADKASQEAAQELSKRERDYDTLFREANQRDANILQVRNQKDELFGKLTGMGFGEMDVRKFVGSTFFERDSTPLTELGKKHVIEKFIDNQAQARNSAIAKKQKAVKEVIADTENGTLMEMTRNLTDDVEFDSSLNGADDLLAMTKALADETKSRGMTKESERLDSFNTGLIEGKLNRIKFPDNPELWVPYEVKKKIQDSFGEGRGSAYAGNLWMNIKAAVTGKTTEDGKFGTLTRKELEAKASKLEGKTGGKLLTGDDDIIIK